MKSLIIILSIFLISCGGTDPNVKSNYATVKNESDQNSVFLSFKLDGRLIECRDIFGAHNPKGYPIGTTMVSGKIGDDTAENFTLVVNNITGLGEYVYDNKTIRTNSGIQYIDLKAKDPFSMRFLPINNKDGDKFTLNFTKLGELDLEGKFEGILTNDDETRKVKITEGKFDTE